MASGKQNLLDSPLLKAVRSRRNLWRAWFHVYPRAAASNDVKSRKAAAAFRQDAAGHIDQLQRKLASGTFEFLPQKGVAKRRGKKARRPIVVAPLENRIVQRAILQTLQYPPVGSKKRLSEITKILSTPTSVGGLPGKGVPDAVRLISSALANGATHYFRSDIRGFFTAISKSKVLDLLSEVIGDAGFVELFSKALHVELENEEAVREWIDLFPLGEVGVPQGSALSTLSGNLLLREFDKRMNQNGLVMVRYIDDFVVLTKSGRAATQAAKKCASMLKVLGLDIYEPSAGSKKAALGEVSTGFDFLSFRFRGSEIAPTREAKQKLLKKVRDEIAAAKREIRRNPSEARRVEPRYVQALNAIDQRTCGWGDSFRHVTRRLEFEQLDIEISSEMIAFENWFSKFRSGLNEKEGRRALGVALLADTSREKPHE